MEEKRLVGTGTLVNGAEEPSVHYEIISYVSNDVRGVDAWNEAGRSVIEYAFRVPGAQLSQ